MDQDLKCNKIYKKEKKKKFDVFIILTSSIGRLPDLSTRTTPNAVVIICRRSNVQSIILKVQVRLHFHIQQYFCEVDINFKKYGCRHLRIVNAWMCINIYNVGITIFMEAVINLNNSCCYSPNPT